MQVFNLSSFLIAGVCATLLLQSNGAWAQSSYETQELLNRISQLEKQINTLNRAVYRGDKSMPNEVVTASPAGAASSAIAAFEGRLSQIEESQRLLTGQLEKALFDIRQIEDRVKLMQADTEQRFRKSSAGGSTSSMATSSAATVTGADNGPDHPVYFSKDDSAEVSATTPETALGENEFKQNSLGTLSSSYGHSGEAEKMYEQAFASIKQAKYEDAENEFKLFIEKFPAHPLTPNSQYWLGETYYVRGNYKEAAKVFAQGYQNFPKSAKAQDSLLKLGLSLSRMGRNEDACLSLKQLQKEFDRNDSPLQQRAIEEIKRLNCL